MVTVPLQLFNTTLQANTPTPDTMSKETGILFALLQQYPELFLML